MPNTETPPKAESARMRSAVQWLEEYEKLFLGAKQTAEEWTQKRTDFFRAIQADASQNPVPEGYKLVPLEPSNEMLNAVLKNIGKWPVNPDGSISVREQFKSDYAVALAFASPPEKG